MISQKNSGVSSARNTGLKEAKGEVLSFIDSDDWVHERFIEDNLKIMIEKTQIWFVLIYRKFIVII